MKVRAFVADDEPVARAGLRAMLGAFDWVDVVGEAADGESAVGGVRALRPELVFLDVQMPGVLGADVLRRLGAGAPGPPAPSPAVRPPFVVFTTAFSEHAVEAFELGAAD